MATITADRTTGESTAAPTRKVAVGGAAGTISVLLVWVFNTYVSPDQPMPSEIASTATTVLTFLVSYFVPPASSEAIQVA